MIEENKLTDTSSHSEPSTPVNHHLTDLHHKYLPNSITELKVLIVRKPCNSAAKRVFLEALEYQSYLSIGFWFHMTYLSMSSQRSSKRKKNNILFKSCVTSISSIWSLLLEVMAHFSGLLEFSAKSTNFLPFLLSQLAHSGISANMRRRSSKLRSINCFNKSILKGLTYISTFNKKWDSTAL